MFVVFDDNKEEEDDDDDNHDAEDTDPDPNHDLLTVSQCKYRTCLAPKTTIFCHKQLTKYLCFHLANFVQEKNHIVSSQITLLYPLTDLRIQSETFYLI